MARPTHTSHLGVVSATIPERIDLYLLRDYRAIIGMPHYQLAIHRLMVPVVSADERDCSPCVANPWVNLRPKLDPFKCYNTPLKGGDTLSYYHR